MKNNSSISMPVSPLSIPVEYKAKSSYPIVKSTSPEGTIGSEIEPPTYSNEQNETWTALFAKHSKLVESNQYLCTEYKEGLRKLNFPTDRVPSLRNASDVLKKSTGWQIIRVEGLVGAESFFKLLANKLFPCTDFIRHKDEIDYTPAPDTFHDQVGHLPMITDQRFADFFHHMGIAGARARNAEELEWLNRIYWFTVEFGLINSTVNTPHYDPARSRIYGSGIASSCGEIVYCTSPQVHKEPFSIDVVKKTTFDIHHMQGKLFEISSFDELEHSFRTWATQNGFLHI